MKIIDRLIFGLLIAVALTGCAKSEIDIAPTNDRIQFRTSTFDTKASSYVPDGKGANIITTMGVYAATTGEQEYNPASHKVNFITDMKVSRADASSPWGYANTQYWPVGKTTFFAYSPHTAKGATISTTDAGAPKIEFTVQKSQKEQVDLMVAKPALNRTKTENSVTMQMQHALTKIGFSAKITHDVSLIPKVDWVKISKIEINGVYSRGTHRMDGDDVWTDLSEVVPVENPYHLDNITDASGSGGLRDIELTHTEYTNITADDGYLLMMPQVLSGLRDGLSTKLKVWVTTSYEATEGDSGFFTDPIEFMLEATALDWKQGEAINYMINIDMTDLATKKATLEAKVTEWQEVGSDLEILQRELNATRLWAKVWGGAVTRIYFWSNQPYVWIENSEIYGGTSSTDFPASPRVGETVNQHFREIGYQFNMAAINAATDKKAVIDAQYGAYNNVKNFHYDPSTGKGYFDVENVTNSGAPENLNYHVFLCASNDKYIDKPLRRSIRLNHILENTPASGNISTPYVGTFHRNNEVGERIITWNNTGDWTAVLMDTPSQDEFGGEYADYQSVLIDRLMSPALEAGILYTDNPGDAEDYNVSEWKNVVGGLGTAEGKRWVSGTDKIYLRVGWDSKNVPPPTRSSVSSSLRNRYAVINIYNGKLTTEEQINRATPVVRLYVRQGEEPDYLMNPTGDYYYPVQNYQNSPDWSVIPNIVTNGVNIVYPINMQSYSTPTVPKTDKRDRAVKFSPYNLIDPNNNPGYTNYNSYTQVPVRGAKFAQYPSQAGYMFFLNYNRLAFNPAVPDAGTGISGARPSDFYTNKPWDAELDEVAPVGFRRPREYQTDASIYYDYRESEFGQSLFKEPAAIKKFSGYSGSYLIKDGAGFINSNQGLYADGFFDRRKIAGSDNTDLRVGKGNEIAYFGSLFFNERTLASLFFAHSGSRSFQGITPGGLYSRGVAALYWSSNQSIPHTDNGEIIQNPASNQYSYGWGLDIWINSTTYRFGVTMRISKDEASPIRCVVDDGGGN
ncbi:hypothetical protein BN938_1010 [Mucinivorans hirudinis]|uniref:Fimbrillin family protein n=1 Tax=Mucinivorans hirudinis TaxID=1433126 RepID=A0A060RBD7_9BACT|nr:hypothetical protein BN938_1010 [Mucinivorans hirudinis]